MACDCFSHPDGGAILEVGDFEDLSGAQELALGELVKERFGYDFFFLDRYPTAIRPFYTMPCPDDDRWESHGDGPDDDGLRAPVIMMSRPVGHGIGVETPDGI